MKLFMTLLVRDEEDIIEANIAYHLSQGVDHIVVTDNGSCDETLEILQKFARAGAVTIVREPADDYNQSAWVTRMARMAAEKGADWVINSDADEMWWPNEGDLKTALRGVAAEIGSVIVRRLNMLPRREIRGHPFVDLVFLHPRSVNGLGDPLPGKAAHRAVRDIVVQQGNHSVRSDSLGLSQQTDALTIFHFPYRSYERFASKIAKGGAAYARSSLDQNWGYVWRKLYERLRAGTLREWYQRLPHAEQPELDDWLRRGEVVKETRLSRYLQERFLVTRGAPDTQIMR